MSTEDFSDDATRDQIADDAAAQELDAGDVVKTDPASIPADVGDSGAAGERPSEPSEPGE